MELGILALRGFTDMKEKARDLMIRNKFIAAQRSCDLRRHLDGAAPEASIWDIVDGCCIWESHAEPVAMDNWWQDPVDSQPTLHKPPPATFGSAQLQHRVGNVVPAAKETTSEGDAQFGRQRASHTKCARSCEIAPEGYSRMVAGKRIGIYVAGYGSGEVSHGRKDISAGESASQGNVPTNG